MIENTALTITASLRTNARSLQALHMHSFSLKAPILASNPPSSSPSDHATLQRFVSEKNKTSMVLRNAKKAASDTFRQLYLRYL